MAELVRIQDNHEGYFDVLAKLFSKGIRQKSRNGETLEVEDLIIEVTNPIYNSPEGIRPGYNSTIGLVEGLQLLAGVSEPGLTAEIQPQFRNYMDDGKLYGAYGPRTAEQFPIIAERLRRDKDTRQAVVTLWDPKLDAQGGKRDHPCTTAFFFLIRGDRLNMKVVMRSMDLWWGWPYDAVQFSMVHQAMANVLNLNVGTYTHHAVSAHLYEPHWIIARDTLTAREISETRQPVLSLTPDIHEESYFPVLKPGPGEKWKSIAKQATSVLSVASGVSPTTVLWNDTQKHFANQLLKRKLKTITKTLEKIEESF